MTNREFIEFIESGQYENQANWDPLDWQWKQTHKLCHPASLKFINGKWLVPEFLIYKKNGYTITIFWHFRYKQLLTQSQSILPKIGLYIVLKQKHLHSPNSTANVCQLRRSTCEQPTVFPRKKPHRIPTNDPTHGETINR